MTTATATKPSDAIKAAVLAALQPADEIGGVDTPQEYVALMDELIDEIERRRETAAATAFGAENRAYVLRVLADADGAHLAWQFSGSDLNLFKQALEVGVIKFDAESDLYVHPDAIKVADGAYKMPQPEYAQRLENVGFKVWETGGGCTAWRAELKNGGYVLITDNASHELDQPCACAIGVYDANDEDGTIAFAISEGQS